MLSLLTALVGLAHAAPTEDFARWAEGRAAPDPSGTVYDSYRFTGHLFPQIAAAAARKPGAVEVERIGSTHGNRPIWAFHVQEPDTVAERDVLVFAGIHALEWISTEVAVDLLLELIEAPPRGARVTVIPLLNPDGRARVEADLLQGIVDRYHRANGAGVDLNRNFSVNRESTSWWRHLLPGYHATSGDHGLSEPESRALDRLVAREGYDRAASLHAFGGYLYFPWAGRWERPDDWGEYVALGREMERAQADHAYRTRQLGRWGFFFRAQGAEIDHLHGEHGVQAYLIELTRSGLGYQPLRSRKIPFRWYNPKDSEPHRARGVAALRPLIRTDLEDG